MAPRVIKSLGGMGGWVYKKDITFILPKIGSKTERFALNWVLYNDRVKKRFKILERLLKVVIPLFGKTYMHNSSLFSRKGGFSRVDAQLIKS